ncbi:MAG: RNA polymerase sigma factor [Dysgonamonadaceae bacterium]|jgi:RNA polymerase sigma-70 factor (ECF subfamily)|nr:RNA polymerase sigma factor [Dysgonamonadaceae bacterium]
MNAVQFQEKILGIQDNMFRFAMMLTTNREDANDLLQDTTLKALDNQDKYVDNLNFKGWVLTIMRNIFINNYRKVVKSQTIIDQTEDLYHLSLPQDSGFESPDGTMTIKEINKAIHGLEPDLKAPFSLFLAGYKYNEIADKLDIPMGTLKNRIFLARQELQEKLKDIR